MGRFRAMAAWLILGAVTWLAAPAMASSTVSPATQNIPSAPVSLRTNTYFVTLKNNNTTAISSLSLSLNGSNPGDFNLSSNCGTSLSSGATCTATVYFQPTALGNRSALLTFSGVGVPDLPQSAALV